MTCFSCSLAVCSARVKLSIVFRLSFTSMSSSDMRDWKAAASLARPHEDTEAARRAPGSAKSPSEALPSGNSACGREEQEEEETNDEMSARDVSSTSSRKLKICDSLSRGWEGIGGIADLAGSLDGREGGCDVERDGTSWATEPELQGASPSACWCRSSCNDRILERSWSTLSVPGV